RRVRDECSLVDLRAFAFELEQRHPISFSTNRFQFPEKPTTAEPIPFGAFGVLPSGAALPSVRSVARHPRRFFALVVVAAAAVVVGAASPAAAFVPFDRSVAVNSSRFGGAHRKPPPPPPPSPTGYDVSYPQCSSTLPKSPTFGIVGVNGGRAYATNACLASEYAWATTSTSTTYPKV